MFGGGRISIIMEMLSLAGGPIFTEWKYSTFWRGSNFDDNGDIVLKEPPFHHNGSDVVVGCTDLYQAGHHIFHVWRRIVYDCSRSSFFNSVCLNVPKEHIVCRCSKRIWVITVGQCLSSIV